VRARVEALQRILPSLGGDPFFLMAGQPEPIRRAWEDAMGLTGRTGATA
jgi:hypothetical protein